MRRKKEKPIDVLFVGSINERRASIIEGLNRAGLKVAATYGLYGDLRDSLYASTKLVVNVHYYEAKIFEIVRCSYLLANSIPVVSEVGADREIEEPFKNAVCFSPFDGIVERCYFYANSVRERVELGNRGFDIFSSLKQENYLQPVISKHYN
jgi:hypothetical protein